MSDYHTAETVESIDITPDWRGFMPVLIAALQDGTPAGVDMAKAELMRLAGALDVANVAKRAKSPN